MIAEVLCAIVSIALLTWSMATRPQKAQAPPGWYFSEGIRTSGDYAIKRSPPGGENDDPELPGTIRGRLHCTGGTRPIVVHYRAVGCQRR